MVIPTGNMKWFLVGKRVPEDEKMVLLCYIKGRPTRRGNTGKFLTEGYRREIQGHSFDQATKEWTTYGTGEYEWYDYTDRLLSTEEAKSSQNEVTHWSELPEKP